MVDETHPGVRRDVVVSVALCAALLAWDATGLDLAVARWFADANGFRAHDSWWAAVLLHTGGRWAAWAVAAALIVVAWRTPPHPARGPGRRERFWWIAVMVLCALAIPAIKQFTSTSCPWDLAEFGGRVPYVSHWRLGVTDGGPGHCFPSGHAVSGFAFFGMYFMWRGHDPRRARLWLAGVVIAGLLFGLAQLARGAHYPGHTLWTAWACWVICVAASAFRAWQPRRARGSAAAH